MLLLQKFRGIIRTNTLKSSNLKGYIIIKRFTKDIFLLYNGLLYVNPNIPSDNLASHTVIRNHLINKSIFIKKNIFFFHIIICTGCYLNFFQIGNITLKV